MNYFILYECWVEYAKTQRFFDFSTDIKSTVFNEWLHENYGIQLNFKNPNLLRICEVEVTNPKKKLLLDLRYSDI